MTLFRKICQAELLEYLTFKTYVHTHTLHQFTTFRRKYNSKNNPNCFPIKMQKNPWLNFQGHQLSSTSVRLFHFLKGCITRISFSSLTLKSIHTCLKTRNKVITEVMPRAARIAHNYVGKAFAAPHGL